MGFFTVRSMAFYDACSWWARIKHLEIPVFLLILELKFSLVMQEDATPGSACVLTMKSMRSDANTCAREIMEDFVFTALACTYACLHQLASLLRKPGLINLVVIFILDFMLILKLVSLEKSTSLCSRQSVAKTTLSGIFANQELTSP